MTLVSTVTVGSGGAATIEWTGIPQTGKDLLVLLSGRSTNAGNTVYPAFNSDTTASNYSARSLFGDGSSVLSSTLTGSDGRYSGRIPPSTYTANTFGSLMIYVPNYTSSNAKSFATDSVTENNATASIQLLVASNWTGTSAITGVLLALESPGTFAQHSAASLYIIS